MPKKKKKPIKKFESSSLKRSFRPSLIKVISKEVIPVKEVSKKDVEVNAPSFEEGMTKSKRGCFFCSAKTLPSYTDIVALKKVLSERGKIVPKLKNGLCSKHQRGATKQVKYARHLSLLPFTPKV